MKTKYFAVVSTSLTFVYGDAAVEHPMYAFLSVVAWWLVVPAPVGPLSTVFALAACTPGGLLVSIVVCLLLPQYPSLPKFHSGYFPTSKYVCTFFVRILSLRFTFALCQLWPIDTTSASEAQVHL